MSERERNLARLLRSVVGDQQVIEDAGLNIDGLVPAALVKPNSAEEVAGCLRICAENDAAVVPAGFATWLETGNPLRRAEVVLSLERMNRIVDYSPPDLTVTVEGGVAIGDLNRVTNAERQWLPLDPPGAKRASLGAIAACSSYGPLRLGFGTPRDYVIGLRLAHADGTESKSGGKVVKNVAGYDLNKLYVGSFGTLGVLTELTFKLRPLPESSATVLVVSSDSRQLIDTAKRILASRVTPASLFLANGACLNSARVKTNQWALLVRFADSAVAVEHQTRETRELAERGDVAAADEANSLWSAVAEIDSLRLNGLRLSVPRSAASQIIGQLLEFQQDWILAADLGIGTVRLAFDAADESAIDLIGRLRGKIEEMGGSLVVERAALGVRALVDAWGNVGQVAGPMQAIKARFDPRSLLNPGRFVCHI